MKKMLIFIISGFITGPIFLILYSCVIKTFPDDAHRLFSLPLVYLFDPIQKFVVHYFGEAIGLLCIVFIIVSGIYGVVLSLVIYFFSQICSKIFFPAPHPAPDDKAK